MTNSRIFYCILFSLCLILQGNAERTKDKMYERIDGTSACFRRLNATHQTGCTSARPGSVGVIHLVNSSTELQYVLENLTAGPYVFVMPVTLVTRETLATLSARSDMVAGVVTHRNVSIPTRYSSEERCPNQNYGLPGQCKNDGWNPWGSGILQGDYPYPIFLLSNDDSLEKIEQCFQKFNNHDLENQSLRSLCALELNSFMFAAGNTETCMRRANSWTTFTSVRFCDPLGDRNIWATLFPWRNDTERVKDAVIVTARMDATSMFYEVTPGAESAVSGLVTLMATAELMARMVVNRTSYERNIFFAILNGESFDYIGSQRLVYDIQQGHFPMERDDNVKNQVPALTMEDIKLVIELGQLARQQTLFVHHLKNNNADTEINRFKALLSSNSQTHINASSQDILPPASIQSFLREAPELPAMLLTDHDAVFSNPFYQSLYDDANHLAFSYVNVSEAEITDETFSGSVQEWLGDVVIALAKSLHEEATGNKFGGVVDKLKTQFYVNELLNCYLDTVNCKIFQAVGLKTTDEHKPLSLYVSVAPSSNVQTALTGFALAWLTGQPENRTEKNCTGDPHNPVYQYFWMSKNLDNMTVHECIKTTMNYSLAISPAFEIADYSWKSGRYSTWTESVWKDLSVRMFLKPSVRHELVTISVGTITLILSMIIVYLVNARSHVLFPRPPATITGAGTSC